MKKIVSISLALICITIILELVLRFKTNFGSDSGYSKIIEASKDNKLIYELIPDSRVEVLGKEAVINNEGRRDSHTLNDSNGSIAFIGDSITFGVGNEQNQTMPSLFELKTGKKTYNFGVMGYNNEQEIEMLKTKVLQNNFSEIYIVFYIDDLFDYKNQTQQTSFKLKTYNFFLQHSALFNYIKYLTFNIINKNNLDVGNVKSFEDYFADDSKSWKGFLSNIDYLKQVNSNNTRIIFVIYPTMSYLNSNNPYNGIYQKVCDAVQIRNIRCLNLLNAFINRSEIKYRNSIYDNHPNEAAQEIAVDYLISGVKS